MTKLAKIFIGSLLMLLLSACTIMEIKGQGSFYCLNDLKNYFASYGQTVEINYPRLAIWWPNSWQQSAEDLARYDFIGWGNWENEGIMADIKKIKPWQKHFYSNNLTETNWQWWDHQPELMQQIPAEWFLTQIGAEINGDINDELIEIEVTRTRDEQGNNLFAKHDTVVCGSESMLITDVDYQKNILKVERGFIRQATAHKKGERIAAHISFWPGSWVMNLSTLCPEINELKWSDFASQEKYVWAFTDLSNWDGLILDRLERSQSWLADPNSVARSIDPEASNMVVSNYQEFDDGWAEGVEQVLRIIRSQLDDKPLLANSFGAYDLLLNGSIFEGTPGNWSDTIPDSFANWEERILDDEGYIAVSKAGYQPNYSWIETYQWDEAKEEINYDELDLGYQKMRWGLTTALLGDGYFSFELNTNGHGSLGLYWFDEYDNAGFEQGYLGQPLGDAEKIMDLGYSGQVWRRDFENGIVICNPADTEVIIDLGGDYQLIKGTQVPEINNGEVVSKITIGAHDGRILLKIGS